MKSQNPRLFLLICFFFFSFFYNSIPALMTTIQEVFLLNISVSSIVPAVLTTGFILAALCSALIIARTGIRVSLMIAVFSGMISCLFFIFSQKLFLFITGIFIFGISYGWGILSLTSAYAHLDKKLQNFGLLHACFGLGGICAPLFLSFLLSYNIGFRNIFIVYFIFFFLITLFMLITKTPVNIIYTSYSFRHILVPLKNITIISCLIIFFFYSGSEIGIVTWAGNLFKDLHHYPKEISVLFITFFWIFFTLGRLVNDFLYRKLGGIRLLLFACLPALGVLIALFFTGRILSVVFFSVSALFLAPVFPVVQKFANSLIPKEHIGVLNGFIYIFAGTGIMVLTPSMGVISGISLRWGYIVPVVGFLCILCILFFGILLRQKKQNNDTN